MARTAISVAIGIAFVSAVIWYALDATQIQCEICVDYKGRHACSISRAADVLSAEAQAHSGACSQVTGGVTETLECDRIGSSVRRCSE
ncbi:MAG: hypothetical protein QMC74_06695 [Myxococcota bacterium]|jgi:hypothetical protein